MKKLLFSLLIICAFSLNAQEYFPENYGVKTPKNKTIAFKNAKIYVTATNVIDNGTLVIKNGKIINVGRSVSVPKNAQVIDLKGKHIYPSFIDVFSDFGIEKPAKPESSRTTQYDATRKGYYWNDHIRPDINPIKDFKFDDKKAKTMIDAGFGIVNTHCPDGIIRGNGLLVALNPNSNDAYRILDDKSAQYLSFSKSQSSRQAYPTSLMGSMALLRQTYSDANWYAKGNAENNDLALEALNNNKNLVQIFNAGSKLNAFRADKIGDQFNIQYVLVGGGDEYEQIQDVKKTNATFVIPLNFRDAYDVSNPYLARNVKLSDMRKWNQEPTNPAVLAKNNVPFAFTLHKLKSPKDLNKKLQKAIEYGLTKTKALEALTSVPARILGKSNIGNLQKGSVANFLITSGDLFEKDTKIYENWTQGDKNVINKKDILNLFGNYQLQLNNKTYDLSITGKADKQKASVKLDSVKVASDFSFKDHWITLNLLTDADAKIYTQLTAQVTDDSKTIKGLATSTDGKETTWTATKVESDDVASTSEEKKKEKESTTPTILPAIYPNKTYGRKAKPEQETILFKNVTLWTSEKEGVIENTDVLIKKGKIAKIGKNINGYDTTVIDGTGKHLTAGIIDEHSHIATSSVNEGAHNSSAEVTIEDVIDPENINIYRNLAGGVTSIQILHGSANPIGGRSAIIKLKWGENADAMLYDNSPKFIKFALGENVKQSRSRYGTRFPQTRMGVEQVYVDYFTRAQEYGKLKKSGKSYRKDFEMETLLEILNKERFISCHSYVQSEINMLMKVAERFDFNINTFTHILEGYKVADKMQKHGVGGSTFSDWWAYKYEVNDAIPYNASIMHNQGVTVAINSDDAEMSRRLNQEAAKSVKYGRMSEEDAWKMITINPAKLLHIDNRVGSVKVGKDADLVLWSDHPLSVYAKPEKTLIEGRVYFDTKEDLANRARIKHERNELINLMLQEKIKGAPTQAPTKSIQAIFHCDTHK